MSMQVIGRRTLPRHNIIFEMRVIPARRDACCEYVILFHDGVDWTQLGPRFDRPQNAKRAFDKYVKDALYEPEYL